MLRAAGAGRIVHVEKSWRELFKGARVIRQGDTVYFLALVYLPTWRGEDEMPPAVQAAEFVHELERIGAVGIEVYTGRRTDKDDERRAMVKVAANSLRAGSRRPPPGFKKLGRPGFQMTAEQEREWRKIWKSKDYATNAEALEAMGNPFNAVSANKYFGPSGRAPGARRKDDE